MTFSSRQARSQTPNSSIQTPSSSTPQSDHSSATNFIYKTIMNSPRMIRKAMTMTPSTDESPMSVRSESPYGKRHGLKLDSGLGRMKDSGDSVTMSAPNTPGSKRALMPRYSTLWCDTQYKFDQINTRSPCGVKIFNPSPSPVMTPCLSGPPSASRRSPSPSPLSRNVSGGSGSGTSGASETSSRQRSGQYLSTSRSSSPTPAPAGLGGKSCRKYCKCQKVQRWKVATRLLVDMVKP